jgi:hypothetical protein
MGFGRLLMAKLRGLGLGSCLLGLLLAGCGPPPVPPPALATKTSDGTSASDSAGKGDKADKGTKGGQGRGGKAKLAKLPEDATQAYKSAMNACNDQATKQTMGSVLTILSRLRPGAYHANYVACMKTKGYEVE